MLREGDILESNGAGNFSIGYLGGLMDSATGLLYVGNRQYYDPGTGRFLNRNAKPDQTNPYVPWGGNPSSAFMAPLALSIANLAGCDQIWNTHLAKRCNLDPNFSRKDDRVG